MRMAQTVTAKILLSVAKRISTPARTLTAINENGLTTGQAVKNDKCRYKSYDKDCQPAQSALLKDWFVSFHIPSNPLDIA